MKLSKSLLCAALLLTAGTSQAQEQQGCIMSLDAGQTGPGGYLNCRTAWVWKRGASNKVYINAWSYDYNNTTATATGKPGSATVELDLGGASVHDKWRVHTQDFTGHYAMSSYFNNTYGAQYQVHGNFRLLVSRGKYTHNSTSTTAKVKGTIATD